MRNSQILKWNQKESLHSILLGWKQRSLIENDSLANTRKISNTINKKWPFFENNCHYSHQLITGGAHLSSCVTMAFAIELWRLIRFDSKNHTVHQSSQMPPFFIINLPNGNWTYLWLFWSLIVKTGRIPNCCVHVFRWGDTCWDTDL